jgi:6-phosphogluconolactonase (cycloisomerase 2 family)
MRQLITIFGLFTATLTFAQSDFSALKVSTDSTYGYTNGNPLKMKKGNRAKSISYSIDFLKSLRTTDNQKLELIKRFTVDDPSSNKSKTQLTNRHTGMPLSGNLELLDKYVFVTTEKHDTVTIYVDIYSKGELKVPNGLKTSDH